LIAQFSEPRVVIRGLVAQIRVCTYFRFPRADLSYGLCHGYAESGVTIEHGDTDLDFRDLPIEVSRHEVLAQKFHTMHLGFDTAPAVVSLCP
jgi:hypothetical protein